MAPPPTRKADRLSLRPLRAGRARRREPLADGARGGRGGHSDSLRRRVLFTRPPRAVVLVRVLFHRLMRRKRRPDTSAISFI